MPLIRHTSFDNGTDTLYKERAGAPYRKRANTHDCSRMQHEHAKETIDWIDWTTQSLPLINEPQNTPSCIIQQSLPISVRATSQPQPKVVARENKINFSAMISSILCIACDNLMAFLNSLLFSMVSYPTDMNNGLMLSISEIPLL
jgi:hypothetical protein